MIIDRSADDEKILNEAGFYWREANGVKVIVSRGLEAAGFVNGFSTRMGGVSPFPADALNLGGFNHDSRENIYENRRRFLAALGVDHKLALAFQVHSDKIIEVETQDEAVDSDEKADAVLSAASGVLAAVKTADCVPILLGDPKTGAFAAVHAGWRGTVQSIAPKTIARMQQAHGSDPAEMVAAIGPAATCKMYEVGSDVIEEFARNFEDTSRYFTPTRYGHAMVDLHAANRDQLIASGIPAENISIAPFCTMERIDLFFSYRIEKDTYGNGRMLSVIGRA
ncbi:MAG TPA: peptidoglycan editing factor PgeF [Pyrinomonadaceae bacterium]|nr:peptidoglycan editing factor PgeF [Pyrinomonadaceae bacterium]